MMKNPYEEYAILEAKIAELEAQKAPLRTAILEDMIDRGIKKEETAVGTFSVSKRKSYTYPETVTKLEEQYKTAKALAESTGEATYEETESLRFTSIKF